MKDETRELLKQIKAYRNDMVARNYPFQQISDIIIEWEMKDVKTTSEQSQDELEPILQWEDEGGYHPPIEEDEEDEEVVE